MADTKKGSAVLGVVVPLLVLTIVAGGGGVLVAKQVVSGLKATLAAEPKVAAAAAQPAPAAATSAVKELPPVVTNLAAPEEAVVRLQAAFVYDKADTAQADILAVRIGADTLAYMKSLTVAQLEGAEGLQHLREDLGERAAMRSDGHVKEVLIEMLVIQ